MEIDGATTAGREHSMFYAGVLGEWLKTFEVAPIAGRDFEMGELRTGEAAAVVNETMATEFWPGTSAIGSRFRFVRDTTQRWFSVVGVIPDMRTVKLDEDMRTPPTAIVLINVLDTRDFGVMLRTAVDPSSITQAAREAISSVDHTIAAHKIWPMDEVKWLSFWMYGLWGATFVVFGSVALFLAAVGVYGVVSHHVGARTHEIGVRLALGARPGNVVRLGSWKLRNPPRLASRSGCCLHSHWVAWLRASSSACQLRSR